MGEKMEKIDLVKILNGDISHLSQVKLHDLCNPGIEVVIVPQHVKSMLLAYLTNEINAYNLFKWAEFIWMHKKLYIINDNGEEWSEYYKEMWNVIQKLSAPT